jgi:cobalt-zinc-cadmium efflux system protein
VVELVVGLVGHSLALIADAGHVAIDASSLVLALVAVTVAARPASPRRTFGLARVEVLGTALGAALLGGLAVVVAIEAVRRLGSPHPIRPGAVLVAGILGFVANAAALLVLRSGHGDGPRRLAVRGALLEVGSDLLGSAAVIVAASVSLASGSTRADPIASLFVALLVAPRALILLRETVDVLMEATPKGVDLDAVRVGLCRIAGVIDVHDLHAWTITSGEPSLSAHVVVADSVITEGGSAVLLDQLTEHLAHGCGITHVTLQLEPAGHVDHEGPVHA